MNRQFTEAYRTMNQRLHFNHMRDEMAQTDSVEINTSQLQEDTVKETSRIASKWPPGFLKRKFSLVFPKYVKIYREMRRQYFFSSIVAKKELESNVGEFGKLLDAVKLNDYYR